MPKRSIEGPQICTKAGGAGASDHPRQGLRRRESRSFRYRLAAPGKNTGSSGSRRSSSPRASVTSSRATRSRAVNDSEAMFLRLDMPGHIKHKGGDTFSEVYLSYHGRIPSSAFDSTRISPPTRKLPLRPAGRQGPEAVHPRLPPARPQDGQARTVAGRDDARFPARSPTPGATSEATCA